MVAVAGARLFWVRLRGAVSIAPFDSSRLPEIETHTTHFKELNMQNFLTFAVETIATVSAIYFVVGLVTTRPQRVTQAEADEIMEAIAQSVEGLEWAEDEAVEVEAVEVVDWKASDPFQLRRECQARGIHWRNAHGKNKHLRKAEMVRALENWESDTMRMTA
jgi:flavin-binding protein dodecin